MQALSMEDEINPLCVYRFTEQSTEEVVWCTAPRFVPQSSHCTSDSQSWAVQSRSDAVHHLVLPAYTTYNIALYIGRQSCLFISSCICGKVFDLKKMTNSQHLLFYNCYYFNPLSINQQNRRCLAYTCTLYCLLISAIEILLFTYLLPY